jgi:hypothetical protein
MNTASFAHDVMDAKMEIPWWKRAWHTFQGAVLLIQGIFPDHDTN